MNETWAIVELKGHVRLGGRLSEEEKFGTKMGRLDVPNGDAFVTQYFHGSNVYRITIVDEAAARAVSQRVPAPVQPWELPQQPELPALAPPHPRFADTGDDRPF